MGKYYDGTKLLSLLDLEGNRPEIYMVTSNRSAGKTTYFSRYLVNRFIKYNEKFCLIYRYKYELDDVSDKFFKEIKTLFFPDNAVRDETRAKGSFKELYFIDDAKKDDIGRSCGYAVALNSAENIKRYSHYFADVTRMFFDEFQSESGNYCPNEVIKMQSVHTSIARGGGEQVRYVPLIMCGNCVSLINPYFTAMGISERLNKEVKFLRGNGFALECGYVEAAAEAQKQSGFNKAFCDSRYLAYSAGDVYLNDNTAFVETPAGVGKYLGTIRYNGADYGIRQYMDAGVIFCDNRPDLSYPYKISVTTDDFNINYVMLRNNDMFISNMRYYFEKGCFRFKNLQCKEAVLKLISY